MSFESKLQSKPCKFCHDQAQYHEQAMMEQLGIYVYGCSACKAEYLYYKNGRLGSYSLYTFFNGKKYRWTVTCSTSEARLFEVLNPDIYDVQARNFKLIHHFSQAPDISPINIKEKIPTYLLFS
jgi:hypothetical protein